MSDTRYWLWSTWAHLIHPVWHTWVPLEKSWMPEDPEEWDEWACWCCDAVMPRDPDGRLVSRRMR